MTTSTATTEFSARQALLEYFEKNALTSFNNSIELLKKRDFYLHAFNKIEQGVDLNAELPELRLVKKTTAQKICKQLAKEAEKAAISAWDLNASLIKIFSATTRLNQVEQALLPCFDVEYKTKTAKGLVKIAVKTWRRNITVTIIGKDAPIDLLYGLVITASLSNNH
jgi:hypothetical protein